MYICSTASTNEYRGDQSLLKWKNGRENPIVEPSTGQLVHFVECHTYILHNVSQLLWQAFRVRKDKGWFCRTQFSSADIVIISASKGPAQVNLLSTDNALISPSSDVTVST